MPVPPGLSPKDADQVLRAVMDDSNNRLRVDAEITAVVTDIEIRAASGDNIAITNQDGTDPLVINPDGSINTKTTIVGGELAVEIDAADGDNIAISNQAGTHKMEVNADGSINITDNGGSLTVDQGTSPWIVGGTVAATQSGAWSVGVNNGPGAAAVNIQDGGNSITVDGTVAATQSGTWNINNITGTVSLPTGASTAANQVTGNASLASIDSKLNTLGQKTSAGSVPVVIASDQSPVTVTGTITTSPNVNVHDGTGVSISSTGSSLNVDVTNIVPVSQSTSPWVVSGTVTSNIGTTGGLALDTSVKETHGSAAGGTAATISELSGGIFNTTPPTLTNGQQASIQLDSSGNLKTTVTVPGTVSVTQGTSPWVDNISQFGGNNVVTGTGASGLGIPRVTVSNDSNVLSTQSGTWNINNITGTVSLPTGASTAANQTNGTQKTQIVDGAGTVVGPEQTISGTNYLPVVLAASATPGAALVARSIQVAGSDGTNAQTLSTDSTGKLNINNISGTVSLPTGAATAANQTTANTSLASIDSKLTSPVAVSQSGTWTVQPGNTANTTPWLVTDSSDGPVTPGTVATKSSLGGGQFNTTPPTLTNGQQAAFQMDSSGNLKTTATVTVPGTVSVTQSTSPWVENVSQFGGNNVVTGTGASGSGIPRVTVANDSNILATQSGTWTVQQGTPPWSVVGNVASAAADSGNPVKVGSVFNTTAPSLSTGQRVDLQSDKNGGIFVTTRGRQKTYSASATNFTAASSATDIFTITGAASTITRINSIRFSGQASSVAIRDVLLIKRSTANTGGTSTTATNIPHDSGDAAASSTVRVYTANPTVGTAVGTVRSSHAQLSGSGTTPTQNLEFIFTENNAKPIVLTSASEVLAVNFNAQTAAGNTLSIDIEWTEE